MSIVIIHGVIGSGKTTKAIELAGNDYILYDENMGSGDLLIKRTIIIDDVENIKKDIIKNIIKFAKGNIILVTSNLESIDKSIKSKARKINTGKIDKRKKKILDKYPNSSQSQIYDSNIFKVLEHIYSNPDRHFVNQMLNNVKPNVYGLFLWLYENGDLELLQYIDREQLFKSKPIFLYSTIAYGIKPKARRIKWPSKSPSKKIDEELKKYFGLRFSDINILKDDLEIPKIKKPKIKKQPKKKTTNKVLKTTKLVDKQTGFNKW